MIYNSRTMAGPGRQATIDSMPQALNNVISQFELKRPTTVDRVVQLLKWQLLGPEGALHTVFAQACPKDFPFDEGAFFQWETARSQALRQLEEATPASARKAMEDWLSGLAGSISTLMVDLRKSGMQLMRLSIEQKKLEVQVSAPIPCIYLGKRRLLAISGQAPLDRGSLGSSPFGRRGGERDACPIGLTGSPGTGPRPCGQAGRGRGYDSLPPGSGAGGAYADQAGAADSGVLATGTGPAGAGAWDRWRWPAADLECPPGQAGPAALPLRAGGSLPALPGQ